MMPRTVRSRSSGVPPGSSVVDSPATPAGMRRLMRSFDAFAEARILPAGVRHDMYVALDEIISNAVKYGGRGARGRMSLGLSVDEDSVRATFSDDGVAFNPLTAPEPDVKVSLEDRQIGGLGIFLVTHLMDEMKYERENGRNCIELVKRLAPR
jgi:anti-sigma regulatory factor (Ser/Thr protein kinase)